MREIIEAFRHPSVSPTCYRIVAAAVTIRQCSIIMGDTDIFNKLSRILETHETEKSDKDDEINALLDRFDFDASGGKTKQKIDHAVRLPDRPTPFEVWKNKQTRADKYVPTKKKVDKLTVTQVEKMVEKMHATNRVKHEEAVRIQNEGLKQELEGYEFKPNINKTSLDLAATMKPISERMPEMVAEKKRILARKREDREKEEMATASFQPTRIGAKTSDKYLKKMGRSAMAKPEDFFLYHQEKIRRNEQRKNIIENIESREMVFVPRLPESSRKIHESMITNSRGHATYDPVTRTTKVNKKKKELLSSLTKRGDEGMSTSEASMLREEDFVEGPPLVLESEHPYAHNRNEYTTVSVPGAVSYEITFSEETSTEPVHDFLRFLKYDDQTVVIGAGKYSGGMLDNKLKVKQSLAQSKANRYNITWEEKGPQRTPSNWPGVNGREPLIIHANKFVVHFKTNNTLNDWGFRMNVVPTIHAPSAALPNGRSTRDFRPAISTKGSGYKTKSATSGPGETVHNRLYKEAITKQQKSHNDFVQSLTSKVKLTLRPWEEERKTEPGQPNPWTATKTHTGKSLLGPALNELLIFDDSAKDESVVLVEYNDTSSYLWNQLRMAKIDEKLALGLNDDEGIRGIDTDDGEHAARRNRKSFAAPGEFSDFSKMRMSDF